MPKFKEGEFALCTGPKAVNKSALDLLKYDNTVVEVMFFHGNVVSKGNVFHNDGDWYEVQAEDGKNFLAREGILKKLPNEYSPADMKELEKMFQPPPKRYQAAKVSN